MLRRYVGIAFIAVMIHALIAICAHADRSPQVVENGGLFLGGRPAALSRVAVTGKLKKDGKYYYKVKLHVKRASGDTDGSLVLFKARTWREAGFKLLKASRGTQWVIKKFFPKSLDNRPFPSVKLNYKYKVYVVGKGFNKAQRAKKGPKNFIEPVKYGLEPGSHYFQLESCVELASHPLKSVYDIYDWFGVVGEMAEQLTFIGLAKRTLQALIGKRAACSKSTFAEILSAKVPNVTLWPATEAVQEMAAWNLYGKVEHTSSCGASQNGLIVSQSVAGGKYVVPPRTIILKMCVAGGGSAGDNGLWRASNLSSLSMKINGASVKSCVLDYVPPHMISLGYKSGALYCESMKYSHTDHRNVRVYKGSFVSPTGHRSEYHMYFYPDGARMVDNKGTDWRRA